MFTLNFLWQQILKKINEDVSNENTDSSFLSYLQDCQLVDVNEVKAIITTPLKINKFVLESDIDIINKAFFEVLGYPIKCTIEYYEDYQKNEIENKIAEILNDNLKPDFTFDNFIVGPCNIEARTAAYNCSKDPGNKAFNPLFIYGDSGLGKTHLLTAIGNYIKAKDSDKKILYISCIDFVNEAISAMRENRIDEYKNRLNNLDVLLVDDIQTLSGKSKTNEVFFNIYNELFNNNKQIVLTSDRPPGEIKDIEDRLKTRFSQGLSVTINSLEDDTAYRILQSKVKMHNLSEVEGIKDEVLLYMAKTFSTDVRSLEGALNRLLFYSINFSKNNVIDLALAMEAFRDQKIVTNNGSNQLDIKLIVKAVSNYYGLTEKQLVSKVRTKNIANARHIAMYLCRKLLPDASYIKIGEEFGGRDHTTVLSACDKIDELIKTNPVYDKVIADIEATL